MDNNEKFNNRRTMIIVLSAVGVIFVGCGLLTASLILPPTGVIDHSVLVAVGEILTFAGALMGVQLRRM